MSIGKSVWIAFIQEVNIFDEQAKERNGEFKLKQNEKGKNVSIETESPENMNNSKSGNSTGAKIYVARFTH